MKTTTATETTEQTAVPNSNLANGVYPRMHVSYYVKDVQKTVAFYTAFFGIEPVKVKEDYAKFILESPSLIISFVENEERVQANFGHLGFQVASKEEMLARLEVAKAHGLPIKEEIGTACCYAMQDKFWVTDPDGFLWEVYYFHEDVEFNDPHFADGSSEVCCMPKTKTKVSLGDLTKKTSAPVA